MFGREMIEPRAQFGMSVGDGSIGMFGGHGEPGETPWKSTFEIFTDVHWNGTLNQAIFNLAAVSVSSDLPIFPDDC